MNRQEALEYYKSICETKSFAKTEVLGDWLDDLDFVMQAILISPEILRHVDNNIVLNAAKQFGTEFVYGYANAYGKIALVQYEIDKNNEEQGDQNQLD